MPLKVVSASLAICVVMAAAGCRRTAQQTSPQDAERVREILVVALDAWRQGSAHELANRKPSVRFSDDDYVDGWQLTNYSLEEANLTTGPINDVRVMLDLRNTQGQMVNKVATYQVGLEPALAVLRADN